MSTQPDKRTNGSAAPDKPAQIKQIKITKFSAALVCFGLALVSLWIRAGIDQSMLAAKAKVLAAHQLASTYELDNGEFTAQVAVIAAIVLFMIGVILCIAASFKRKAHD